MKQSWVLAQLIDANSLSLRETLKTLFIERHSLSVRQGSAYLNYRTICYARHNECLEDQAALLQCYHSFVRLHRALQFGQAVRTPAMQAGLDARKLSFRDVSSARVVLFLFFLLRISLKYIRWDSPKLRGLPDCASLLNFCES